MNNVDFVLGTPPNRCDIGETCKKTTTRNIEDFNDIGIVGLDDKADVFQLYGLQVAFSCIRFIV